MARNDTALTHRRIARALLLVGIACSVLGLFAISDNIGNHLLSKATFLLPCGVIILAWVNIKLRIN